MPVAVPVAVAAPASSLLVVDSDAGEVAGVAGTVDSSDGWKVIPVEELGVSREVVEMPVAFYLRSVLSFLAA